MSEQLRQHAAKKDDPSGEKQPEKRTLQDLREIISPDFLKMISAASGGFRFAIDATLSPGSAGYTDMRSRTIFINPLHLQAMPAQEIRGFGEHEAGHHAPEVIEFQDMMTTYMQTDLTIPPAFNQSPSMREKFLGAMHRHLHNALADVWLESFMGRRPFFSIRDDIASMYEQKRPTLMHFSKPEQLAQLLVGEARFPKDIPIEKLVDEDVLASYGKIVSSGAMKSLQSVQDFENPFAKEVDRHNAVRRKFNAYSQIFLPEYLRLLEKEALKRIAANPGSGGDGPKKQGDGKRGEGQPGGAGDMAARRDVLEDLLDELTKAGEKYASLTPSDEDKAKDKAIRITIREIAKGLEGKGPRIEVKDKGPSGLDAIAEQMGQFDTERRESMMRGLAESMGRHEAAVRQWVEIKEEYKEQIESTASALAEVFLENRRSRIEYLMREGDIVPGLEFETVSAVISGEHDPETKMRSVRDPEFLETELQAVVDQSGSMKGRKLQMAVALFVVIIEAMKRVRETLEAENLLSADEQPLRVSVTGFDVKPRPITGFDEPLSDAKEVKIVEEMSQTFGGTDEAETLQEVHDEMKLRSKNVLKILLLLGDGHGNKEGVEPIIQQIEADNEVVMLAVGLGETDAEANAVVASYLDPVKNREANVFAVAKSDMAEVLPFIIDFLKREVEKRRGMFA